MNKIRLYFQDTGNELFTKVSWPTWSELQASAILVMVASLLIALLVFGMDTVFQFVMNLFYGLFK